MSNLADRLKFFRKKASLTQQEVATALGIERSTYAYYEASKTKPKLETLKMLARLYNTNIDMLIENDTLSDREDILSSPDRYEKWYVEDRLNQLSDFEKAVLLRVRLMSADEKKKLIDYIDNNMNKD